MHMLTHTCAPSGTCTCSCEVTTLRIPILGTEPKVRGYSGSSSEGPPGLGSVQVSSLCLGGRDVHNILTWTSLKTVTFLRG